MYAYKIYVSTDIIIRKTVEYDTASTAVSSIPLYLF